MKTNTTETEIAAIVAALAKLHVRPFRYESGDPKHNAQRNLSGKTHYVDDDTLRWHKSRVLGTATLHGGLLFRVTCSDALDMNNTRRGFHCAVFDVFGTTVNRPDLEHATKTHQAAINASEREEIDLVKHYREALDRELHNREESAAELREAMAMLPQQLETRAA